MPLPEDTWDADYGAMLERAYGKGVSSPTGIALLGLTGKPPKMGWILPLAA
jgi:hypothetical protein